MTYVLSHAYAVRLQSKSEKMPRKWLLWQQHHPAAVPRGWSAATTLFCCLRGRRTCESDANCIGFSFMPTTANDVEEPWLEIIWNCIYDDAPLSAC